MENNIKEFTIRELTKRGWTRRRDLDFSDDGTRFKALEYTNGLIASYTKGDGLYFLDLRIDYLTDLVFEEYSKMDSYKLAGEFNGVEEIDADKVCRNAEEIMKEYLEVKEMVEKKEIDIAKIIKQVQKEKSMVDRVLAQSNITIEELSAIDDYDLRRLKEYRTKIKRDVETRISYLAEEKYSHKELRQMVYRINNCGYLVIDANGYYINTIKQIVKKAKGE